MACAESDDPDIKSLKDALKDDFTECSICMEEYKDPKVLPCLHSFCEHCLLGYVEARGNPSEFPCPLCQEATVVPEGGVSSLKSNVFIQKVQNTVGLQDKTCDVCQENDVASYCVDCKESLCQDCASFHTKTKLTRKHKVIPIEKLSDEDIQEKRRSFQDVFCPAHKGKVVEYFCKPCQTPICRDCTVLDHHGHESQSLQEAADNFKKTLQPHLESLHGVIFEFIQSKSAINKQSDSWNDVKMRTDQSIKQWASTTVAQVRQREAELLEESNDMFGVTIKKIKAIQDEIELKLGVLQSTMNQGYRTLEQDKNAEILSQLTEKIVQLEQEKPPRLETKAPPVTLETSLINIKSNKLVSKKSSFRSTILAFCDVTTGSDGHKNLPTCVSVLSNGDTVFVDNNSSKVRLCELLQKRVILKWEVQVGSVHLNSHPWNVVVTRDNDIMVSKSYSPEIDVLNVKGQILRKIKTNISCASPGLAVLDENRIVITDSTSKCFHICDLNGTVTKTVRHKSFQCPRYVACSLNGNIIISDCKAHIIVIFNQECNHISTYGTTGFGSSGSHQLHYPSGICTDRYNNIIVADTHNHNVVILDSEGNFFQNLFHFCSRPAVAVAPDGCLIVTSSNGSVEKVKYLT